MKNILNFAKTISIAFALSLLVFSVSAFAKNPPAKMSTPSISKAGSSQVTIQIQFTAGTPTGAPAGFSLQWMTAADYAANGNQWYASDDTRLCKASFSGNAN